MNTVNNSNLNFNDSRAFPHDSRNFSFISFSFTLSSLRDFFVEKHWPGEAFVEIQRVVVRATCDISRPRHCHCNKSCITNVAFPFIHIIHKYIAYRLPINLFMEYETILLD